jgi:hypothetical protein
MPDDAKDKPALTELEAEVIDLEVVSDQPAGAGGMSPEDMMKMAPEMVLEAFRGMLKERLKKWFIRSLIWCTVLLIFYQEHGWVRVVFWIWATVAAIHLAFLLYGWYASGKHVDRLAKVFGGMGAGDVGRDRQDS